MIHLTAECELAYSDLAIFTHSDETEFRLNLATKCEREVEWRAPSGFGKIFSGATPSLSLRMGAFCDARVRVSPVLKNIANIF